jgi:hypothetical protein
LDSLEDFRKNPHVEILPKSPPTNFQSLGIFKNPFFIQKRFFLQLLAQSAQRPAVPSGLSAHTAQPVVSFLLPHRALATALLSRDSAAGESPPRRLPCLGISQIRLPVVPSFFSPPHGKPPWPGAATRPIFSEPLPPATVESMVEPWTGHPGARPRAMDRVNVISY